MWLKISFGYERVVDMGFIIRCYCLIHLLLESPTPPPSTYWSKKISISDFLLHLFFIDCSFLNINPSFCLCFRFFLPTRFSLVVLLECFCSGFLSNQYKWAKNFAFLFQLASKKLVGHFVTTLQRSARKIVEEKCRSYHDKESFAEFSFEQLCEVRVLLIKLVSLCQ